MTSKLDIALIVCFVLLALWFIVHGLTLTTHGEKYTNKNYTMMVYPNTISYCVFGNPEKSTVVCNSFDTKGKNMQDFDDYIQAFIDDRVQRSYKVLVP